MERQPPPGFIYLPEFLTREEEAAFIGDFESREFQEVKMRGVVAKRKTIHFGHIYGYQSWQVTPGPPIPESYQPLMRRAAELMEVAPNEIEELLVSRYPDGAGIGWHRDAPMFGPKVVGMSFGAPVRFKLRKRLGERKFENYDLWLEPRSAYVLGGEARAKWQHSIPETKGLRYSLTFRTMERKSE